MFLTSGVGHHPVKLVSFELALRHAQLEAQNLVPVSSICPPHCKIIPRDEGVVHLRPGEITFCVMSRSEVYGDGTDQSICSAVGLAIPKGQERFGYIFEHHTENVSQEDTEKEATDWAAMLLASSMDNSLDMSRPDAIPTEMMDNIDQLCMAESASSRQGEWTTVVAAAIYIF